MQINALQVLLQIVNFAILLAVLTKFLYKPFLKILEARARKIEEGLEAAEKSLEEKAKIEAKKQEILTRSEQDAAEILETARLDAKQVGKDIVTAAKKEAQESVAKEYQILESRIKEEELKVRHNIANLVTQTTSTILQGALSDKSHQQIIRQQINKLQPSK